ncbi:hypothetical protein [Aureispira sp. CCB-E]|uniref:hypothetical protein n=1 Tax=Aureispira sp. CCB-E TaxID=3051121 RepID=UPI002868937F|nr:hypothetical protein [Aureispira sp. CCB-E]WMX12224.1 hypothetical protein QP953_15460 [Aureispira sp. CCB-E]
MSGLLLPLLAIITGMLAAASVVVKKSPDAANLIKKIKPYEAGIGAASLILGILKLLNIALAFRIGLIWGLVYISCVASCIVMGFLLGYPVLQDLLLDELSEDTRAKSAEMYERLTPYKVTSGLVAMGTGLYLLVIGIIF